MFDTAMDQIWKGAEPAAAKLAEVQARSQAVIDRHEAKRAIRARAAGGRPA
jgi:hypothetical protein